MSNKRLIDGTTLMKRLSITANRHRNDGAQLSASILMLVHDEIRSGVYDIPNQGEAARLREALKKLDTYIDFSEPLENGDWGIEDVSGINAVFAEVKELLDSQALSPHTEDTGIQKVRDALQRITDLERLTYRAANGKNRVFFKEGDRLIIGTRGRMMQKKELTTQIIHDKFVALDKVIERLAMYEDIAYGIPGITDGGESDA